MDGGIRAFNPPPPPTHPNPPKGVRLMLVHLHLTQDAEHKASG